MTSTEVDFVLPNVGPGPDPLRLSDLADAVEPADPTTGDGADPAYDAVVVLLQRDHHCGNCRRQVRAVADRYDEFRDRRAEVVSVVPEPRETVESWQASYELPFPLCADPETVAAETFEQPVRFGPLGRLSDLLGRMPAAIVLDARDPGDVAVAYVHRGASTWDRPDVDDLLAELDALE